MIKSNILHTRMLTIAFAIVFALISMPLSAKEIDISTYQGTVSKGKISPAKKNDINWQWWEQFNDPYLTDILQKSLENNFDITIADIKTKEARNYLNSSKRNIFPNIKIGAGHSSTKYSNLSFYGREIDYTNKNKKNLIILPLQASYELDFWDKNQTEKMYFLENKNFYDFEKKSIILSTMSQVSSIYFNILKNEKLISLYEQNNALKNEKLNISLEKLKLALIAKPEILDIKKQINLNEKDLNLLKAQNRELKNQLNLLVFGDKEKQALNFENMDDISLFYDSELEVNTHQIAKRPDILMAEQQIKMAKLDAEATRKALLPSFQITGDLFQITDMFNNFFSSESIKYRIGGGLLYNLFEKGKNKSELEAKKNQYKQMLKTYEKTIVSSINDVNSSLYYLKNSMKNYDKSKEISGLDQENMDIEKEKLTMELISYQEYIEAKERLVGSKIQEYESKTRCLIHTISLYKALGGNV